MSSLAFLVTVESRRKHPEIREVRRKVLIPRTYVHAKAAEKSLAILRSSPEQATASLASDSAQSDDLLRPVFVGCATKNAKVVAISLGSLQRLIALKAVPQSAVALIVTTMNDATSQGVDIQHRILQTLVFLITNFPSIHGELLGKLQDSRIAVVSSTAATTLRQLVMFIFEKLVNKDRQKSNGTPELSEATLPDGSTKALVLCAKDAFSVFADLCLLANSEKPNFLKLDYLRPEFSFELETKAEVFLMRLIRMISEDSDASNPDHSDSRPIWTRVLAMEIMRGVCSDAELVRNICDRYDAQQPGSKVFSSFIVALRYLVTDNPALLGVSAQMMWVGISLAGDSAAPSGSNYSQDVGVLSRVCVQG
ncbi:hypothetical protein F4604DRAFT_1922593 [Suillus subluteus]|nr:hypothetical protein F4604DRAFT_1922593 [Suillus subluteus]